MGAVIVKECDVGFFSYENLIIAEMVL